MTTATASHTTNYGTTDVWYRAWGSAFSAALAGAGLIQTGDTGQVDWATVTIPATNTTTTAPYEVWRFDDALQATAPIFLKIHYARNIVGNIRICFILATGSNGSGTMTGAVHSLHYLLGDNTNAVNGAPASTTYVAYGSGYLTIVNGFGNPCRGVLLLERTTDSTGAPTADGVLMTRGSNSLSATDISSGLTSYSPSPSVAYGLQATRGSMAPYGFSTSVFGSDIMLLPRWYMVDSQVYTSHNSAIYSAGAVVAGTVFTTSLAAGVPTRNYMACGDTVGATFTGIAMQLCARYE